MPDIFVDINRDKNPVSEEVKKTEHKHLHLFASFCENPGNINFADKMDHEEILLFLRRHFITNIPWILKALALSLIPVILFIINSLSLASINILPSNYTLLIIFFYYFLVFGYVFTNYITWFYNISLITNERIVDIDFSQIVFENVAATKLTQVEDVHYSQIGVIRSVFDYGDVILQTAGTLPNFDFLAVPHPEKVIKVIGSMIGASENA